MEREVRNPAPPDDRFEPARLLDCARYLDLHGYFNLADELRARAEALAEQPETRSFTEGLS